MASTALEIDIKGHIRSIFRLDKRGKSPLLFVKFTDRDTRNLVLKNARKLHRSANIAYKTVYINEDLTKAQLERMRLLRTELKSRRDKGEKITIRDWKIVPSKGGKTSKEDE